MLANSITIRIIHTSLFSFFCYLTIGILLAVVPGLVHLHLGLSALWAGAAVSSQYVATLVTRPTAGRMTDILGPKTTVLIGQLSGLLSGLCLISTAVPQSLIAGAGTCVRHGGVRCDRVFYYALLRQPPLDRPCTRPGSVRRLFRRHSSVIR